jgi:F0F1-type ATP synthase membrane subunit c/vacuolar-type H+-ATPase subunit K
MVSTFEVAGAGVGAGVVWATAAAVVASQPTKATSRVPSFAVMVIEVWVVGLRCGLEISYPKGVVAV